MEGKELKIPIFSKYKNACVATRQLPNYKIKTIVTGQFNESGRLWQTNINLDERITPNKQFTPFNLSDKNWEKGISLSRAGFFIKNSIIDRHSIKIGDKLKFHSSGKRSVTNIIYSKNYINIFVDGDKLDPAKDGYPNIIKKEKHK